MRRAVLSREAVTSCSMLATLLRAYHLQVTCLSLSEKITVITGAVVIRFFYVQVCTIVMLELES